jgi:ADP-heptose:LPS heptosyltransferase
MMQENKKHILVIKHGALGDLMQSIGILMDIRLRYPSGVITLLTSPAYLQLAQRCPYINAVIVDNRAPIWRVDQQFKLQRKLQRQPFDLVIDLQNSDRSRMYRQFWIPKTEWIGRSAEAEAPVSGLAGLIELLNNAGIPVQHAYHPDMSWMVADVSAILNQHGIDKEYIALIPGSSSKHLHKRWPYYAALATALINEGQQVVVILGPEEADIGKQMPGHLIQGLNWFELAGVLNGAKFVVGNDTGPSHIASYLNKSGLAIFGPTTSAARAEIGHRNFKTIEVDNLAALTFDQVLTHLIIHLKSNL